MRYFIARWDIESLKNTLFSTNKIYRHSTHLELMLAISGFILFAHSNNNCCCSYHVSGYTSGVLAGNYLSGVRLTAVTVCALLSIHCIACSALDLHLPRKTEDANYVCKLYVNCSDVKIRNVMNSSIMITLPLGDSRRFISIFVYV